MDQCHSFLDFPEKLARWRRFLPYVLLLSVTFALYGATLYFDFVWDDFDYIVENYAIQGLAPAHLRVIWTTPFAAQYAPLHHSFLAFVYFLSGLEPFGYHLSQFLLHAACVCMLYFVLKNIESARVAFLGTLLFALYPPNIETVAWVSETKSTLSFLFFLLSFWAFLRLRARERWSDGVLCSFFLVLALLTKINIVVAPVIFLLYDYKQHYAFKKGRAWSLGCFFVISAIFTGVHLTNSRQAIRAAADRLVDAVLTTAPTLQGAGGYSGGVAVRLLNLPRFLFFYVRMAAFPFPLSAWRMFRVFEELNWTEGAAWIALLGLLWLLYRSPRDLQFWELWFYVFLIPVLQIVPNLIWVADRYLYIPAIGAFVLASKLFFYVSGRLSRAWERLGWEMVMAGILVSFAWTTHRHLPVWRNDLTLWEATTKTCSTSAYCHGRLGKARLRNGQADPALREFLQAAQIRPAPVYFIYLGDAYADQFANYKQALLAYGAARQSGPLPLYFWAKVARTYYRAGELDQAGRVIEAGRKLDADDPGLLLVDGFLQWKQGNWSQARSSLQRVLAANTLYPQSSNAAKFINYYWGNPSEVGRLLADLGPLQMGPVATQSGQR